MIWFCSTANRTGRGSKPRSGRNVSSKTYSAMTESIFCGRSPSSGRRPRAPVCWILVPASAASWWRAAAGDFAHSASNRIASGKERESVPFKLPGAAWKNRFLPLELVRVCLLRTVVFDLITMNQVMEHVSDQAAVLREALRVLKDGGAIYIASPNYLKCYEPHYKIRWFPLLPKFAGRWYLKFRRRDPVLLDQLTYTTNARLRALFRGLGAEYLVLDLHRENFLKKCAQARFASRRARLVAKMTRWPVLGRLILKAVLRFGRITEQGCEMMILHRPRQGVPQC